MSAQQLQAVFQELDYLDDGYEDGLVSHVGLRRIILETPELEADLGPTFTRALLARAEQNIYGRLTFEEFLLFPILISLSLEKVFECETFNFTFAFKRQM